MSRTPEQIIGADALAQLICEGFVVVPDRLPSDAVRAVGLAMPPEVRFWQDGHMLRIQFLSEEERVDPRSVWKAAITYFYPDASLKTQP